MIRTNHIMSGEGTYYPTKAELLAAKVRDRINLYESLKTVHQRPPRSAEVMAGVTFESLTEFFEQELQNESDS